MPAELELKEFIKKALHEILDAVLEAASEREPSKGIVNPRVVDPEEYEPTPIDFDVAVTVSRKTKGEGKAGLAVLAADIGGKASREAENSHVARIKFSIPVALPMIVVTDVKKLRSARQYNHGANSTA